ncbi:MAG: hypothetical protein ACOYO9_06285 [Candidatus Nanopelagicales bacterium]
MAKIREAPYAAVGPAVRHRDAAREPASVMSRVPDIAERTLGVVLKH